MSSSVRVTVKVSLEVNASNMTVRVEAEGEDLREVADRLASSLVSWIGEERLREALKPLAAATAEG